MTPTVILSAPQAALIKSLRDGALLTEYRPADARRRSYFWMTEGGRAAKIRTATVETLSGKKLVSPDEEPANPHRVRWDLTGNGRTAAIQTKTAGAPANPGQRTRQSPMKVYSLGNHGFVSADVLALLGVRTHIHQQQVLVAARNRREAARLVDVMTGRWMSANDSELHPAVGRDVEALIEEGAFDRYRILVTDRSYGHRSTNVVTYGPQRPYLVGSLVRHPDEPGSPMKFTPAE